LRFATGLSVLQLLWLLWLALPDGLGLASFAVLAVAEMLVPVWAERALDEPLFHVGHIEERYGLFTIIMLGESILSATVGFRTELDAAGVSAELLAIGLGGLVIAFSAWWLYFDHPGHLAPTPAIGFRWGYGHVLVFVSLAALGAGLHLAAEQVVGHADERTSALAVAIPCAGFVLGLALLILLTGAGGGDVRVYPKVAGGAVMLLVGLVAPVAAVVVGCALVMVTLVVGMILATPAHHAADRLA
jgi:low temperature requirement protein LtrA